MGHSSSAATVEHVRQGLGNDLALLGQHEVHTVPHGEFSTLRQ